MIVLTCFDQKFWNILKEAQLKPSQIQNSVAAAEEELRNIRLLHHHTNWFSSPSWATGPNYVVPNTTAA
jgi:hypothetical protein